MKSISLALILLCLQFKINAQQLPEILKTQEYKRGIYKNFGEFLKNEPSITGDFDIYTKNNMSVEDGKEVYLVSLRDSSQTSEFLKQAWGFSNGKKIFVNERNYGQKYGFRPLLTVSRYCVHEGSYTKHASAGLSVSGTPVISLASIPVTSIKPYILNINNGRFFLLNKDIVRTILAKDKQMLDDYEAESGKGSDEVMFRYIETYNKKYFNEATGAMVKPIEVTFLRKERHERDENLTVMLSDSTTIQLKKNSVFRYNSFDKSIRVCLNGNCHDVTLTKNAANYFECSWKQKNTVPAFEKVDVSAGEYYAARFEVVYASEQE